MFTNSICIGALFLFLFTMTAKRYRCYSRYMYYSVKRYRYMIEFSELIFIRGIAYHVLCCFIIICYKPKFQFLPWKKANFISLISINFVAVIFCQHCVKKRKKKEKVAADANGILFRFIALTGLFGRIFL